MILTMFNHNKMSGNSIYEYYQKVSERFYSVIVFPSETGYGVKYIWEPLARKVSIKGFEEYDFFLLGQRKDFVLHEGITGKVVIRQCEMQSRIMRHCTAKLFLDCLPAEINRKGGRPFLNKLIVDWIVDHNHEISPRYKVKN